MYKKSIYFLFLFVLIAGAVIVFQSCNKDNPISQNESPTISPNEPIVEGDSTEDWSRRMPNRFYGFGAGYPQKCPHGPQKLQLWAADCQGCGKTLVGYIEFLNVTASSMTVKYVTNVSPWIITCIRFHMGKRLQDIPVKTNHNADPDNYQYKFDFPQSEAKTSHSFQVTLPTGDCPTGGYYVSAEACVCKVGGLESLPGLLPPMNFSANMCVIQKENGCGYWKFNITNAGSWNGTNICGWGIDAHHNGLPPANCANVNLMSSYNYTLDPDCDVSYPENLPLVNYLLNKYQAGTQVAQWDVLGFYQNPPQNNNWVDLSSTGNASVGDIQYAIWYLLEGITGTVSSYNFYNVWGMIHDAYTNGANYRPTCGKKVAIIIGVQDPGPGICYQPMLYMVDVPCGSSCCTIAWADGKCGASFPRSHTWATYFRWGINCYYWH